MRLKRRQALAFRFRDLDLCSWYDCKAAGRMYWIFGKDVMALCQSHHETIIFRILESPAHGSGWKFIPERSTAEVMVVMRQ